MMKSQISIVLSLNSQFHLLAFSCLSFPSSTLLAFLSLSSLNHWLQLVSQDERLIQSSSNLSLLILASVSCFQILVQLLTSLNMLDHSCFCCLGRRNQRREEAIKKIKVMAQRVRRKRGVILSCRKAFKYCCCCLNWIKNWNYHRNRNLELSSIKRHCSQSSLKKS